MVIGAESAEGIVRPPVTEVRHSERGFGCCAMRASCRERAVYFVVRRDSEWTITQYCCAAHLPLDASPANFPAETEAR